MIFLQGGRNRGKHYYHIYSSINMESSFRSDKDSWIPPPLLPQLLLARHLVRGNSNNERQLLKNNTYTNYQFPTHNPLSPPLLPHITIPLLF